MIIGGMHDRMDVLKAIKCCREDRCDECPLQGQICDTLFVEMTELPTELVELIEEILERNS